jgi:hypothetical protein
MESESPSNRSFFVCLLTLITAMSAVWLPGCATIPDPSDQTDWIEIGKTTKADMVERYGDPDVAQKLAMGSIVTYFPVWIHPPSPTPIPTIQTMQPTPAGFGVAMTNALSIDPI